MNTVTIIDHPLVTHKLTILRKKEIEIETSICKTTQKILADKSIVIVLLSMKNSMTMPILSQASVMPVTVYLEHYKMEVLS